MSPTILKPSETEDGWAHLKQSRDSWYMRLFLWFYMTEGRDLNTCWLFWGFVLMPLLLPVRVGMGVGRAIISRMPEPEKEEFDMDKWLAEREAKRNAPPSRMERILRATANFLSAAWAKFEPVLKVLVTLLLAAAVIIVAVAIVVAFINDPMQSLLVLGATILALLLFAGAIWYIEERNGGVIGKFFKLLRKLGRSFHRHTCAKIDLS